MTDLRRSGRGGRRVLGPVPGWDRLPVRVPRRDLLQGEGEPTGGVPGGGDRHPNSGGVTADGRREVLGFDVGDSEDGAFWTAFLRSLKARGLGGVQLVISDAHTGLKAAIGSVFLGAAWQRCRVHFMRNVLAVVPKGNQEMVAAAIRTIFAQPNADHVTEQFEVIATMLGKQLPKVEQMLREAHTDLLACAGFPVAHWKKVWSTNPLERLNKEVKRRTDVVGVFPNPAALLRLAGAVLVEAHDEWQVSAERRYLSERSTALVAH